MNKRSSILLSFFLLVSCGAKSDFKKALKLEEKGKYSEAWEAYQRFVFERPDHELAPEALFRAGWVVQQGKGDCYMANVFYEKVRTQFPQSQPWARAAALQVLNCPDYFPLIPGSEWEEGDSDTKGRIARTISLCRGLDTAKDSLPSEAAKIVRTYYAGNKKFRTTPFIYKKVNDELLEFLSENDSRSRPIMKWPLKVGTKWRARLEGRFFNYEVVEVDKTVKVQAGEFPNCIKIKSTIEGSPGGRNEYFAPNVGRILTTLSTSSGEKRNTELLTYKMANSKGYNKKEKSK